MEYIAWARASLDVRVDESVRLRRGEDEHGLFCTGSAISRGTELVRVPFESLLHVLSPLEAWTESECRWVTLVASVIEKLDREDDMLAIRLLYEARERRKDSKWYEHIRRFPEDAPPHSLLRWTADELYMLRGLSVGAIAGKWEAQLEADFKSIRKIAKKASDDRTIPGWLTLDNYKWAIAMIWSRCVSITKPDSRYETSFKVFVPVFDMANHDSKRVVAKHAFDASADAFVMEAVEDVEPGDEIRICYSSTDSSSRLLLLYGFVDADNEANESLDVYAPLPEGEDVPNRERKYRALVDAGFKDQADGVLPFSVSVATPVPHGLLVSQRIMVADGPDVDRLDHASTGPLANENERLAVDALRTAFSRMRAAIPYHEGDDADLIDLEDPDPKVFRACVVRRAERRILNAALGAIAPSPPGETD